MIIIVGGNILVIIAIATERSLKGIQNWFIGSLAVADCLLGAIIMPFSLANEMMGYWVFGQWWCDVHSAVDVLLCTSSIMNLCLISLDRYWSITHAIEYLRKRTPERCVIMITTVWILSGLVSIPPLLGWKKETPQGEFPKCELSEDIGYVLYSALGSFYIPSCIMVFVYIRIYYAARARARRNGFKVDQPFRPSPQQKASSNAPSAAPSLTAINESSSSTGDDPCQKQQTQQQPTDDIPAEGLNVRRRSKTAAIERRRRRRWERDIASLSSVSRWRAAASLIRLSNVSVATTSRRRRRRRSSTTKRISRQREKRATLILGLIMGAFIACWLPFFFLYLLAPVCPSCNIQPWGFAFAFWLGYINSALNPVIYTIFNKDFRRAFRRILFRCTIAHY
ncbi:hypothetical protein DAPPUDRAFT_213639 [Daphnia pulex]|uniref:G-protein coupled receptors family 1 profile domain-containing protein n=1 Tax=Daphnia pulex TaxID=6669 RepID=E9GTW4_DAPPU|nr:hypothetical protein DAPPUDRAFT_213639 [Daphnia pulex]|eukprot:EFX76926.1 hypothetical protein DAPPUDRAFT_213639 [Daphnia pulex]